MINKLKFFDVKGVCRTPIIVSTLPNGKIEVNDRSDCERILFHRFVGQEFTCRFGNVIEIGVLHSRSQEWNKSVEAANGGIGEAAGFNTPCGGRIQHIGGKEVRV